ncbi:type II toxin-antitoxin system HipA family toxin [Agrobacterium sp. NPDC089420]|uniref:type II toxin-antitoxin system HipA family toxin n=1 Tax=Agrobacterium sp. NPDC089420 TaxID=3363918 RepID=UPI00384A4EE9
MKNQLDVYFQDAKAGSLRQSERGELDFSYDESYLSGNRACNISHSMPLRAERFGGEVVRSFFSGLLPDGNARRRLADILGVSAGDTFGLLKEIGRECAGAIGIYPSGEEPGVEQQKIIENLSTKGLHYVIERLRTSPLLACKEGIRLSLAGTQEKLPVLIDGDAIALARNGHPTTHILKIDDGASNGILENEFFCLQLAARLKLQVPHVELRYTGVERFLLIERYDRFQTSNGTILRVHQEDFCQALGIPPERKHEIDGGPNVEQSFRLIDQVCARPAADRLKFIRGLVFNYLIGNSGAHGKDYALLYRGAAPDLAPFYDLICTAVHPLLHKKTSVMMEEYSVRDVIALEHWLTLVPQTQGAQRFLVGYVADMANTIEKEAQALLADLAVQGLAHEVMKKICSILSARKECMLRSYETPRVKALMNR